MSYKSYSEKLLDPKWQQKRLKVLERDQWKCRICENTKSTLHVHHLCYHGNPWATPPHLLLTLCKDCHEIESQALKAAEYNLIYELKNNGLMSFDIEVLTHAISKFFKAAEELKVAGYDLPLILINSIPSIDTIPGIISMQTREEKEVANG